MCFVIRPIKIYQVKNITGNARGVQYNGIVT